tara:strand:+ start:209 stop:685 length:477 start_codon:yes stop_codon:yes gene_type:complete
MGQLEVEAAEYSQDFKQTIVYCPKCGERHVHQAESWAVNAKGVFFNGTWYGFTCNCQQDVTFMLSFESVPMLVGKNYLVVRPAHSFGEIDGEIVNFEEQRTEVEVLPKPTTVIVCDGESETIEAIPEHLARDDWYAVRIVGSGKRHWLNTKGCQVILL